jgi:hypothetical protein
MIPQDQQFRIRWSATSFGIRVTPGYIISDALGSPDAEFPEQSVTLPANATRWIYGDTTNDGALTASATHLGADQGNLYFIGRVVTGPVGVVSVDQPAAVIPPDGIDLLSGRALTLGNLTVSGNLTVTGTQTASSTIPTVEQRRFGLPNVSAAVFDGATSGTRITSTLTGQNIGTGDFSMWARFRCPIASLVSSNPGILALGPNAADGSGANSFRLGILASGALYIRTNDAASLTTNGDIAGFVSTYSGQIVDVVITRTGSTLKVYINGVDTAYVGTLDAANSINSVFFHLGIGTLNVSVFPETIFRAVLFNRALSQNDVTELVTTGVNPADQWGTTTPVISPSVLNGGFETAGSGGTDAFASWIEATTGSSTVTRDTVVFSPNGGAASAKITLDGANSFANVTSAASHVAGKRYRLSLDYRHNGSAAVPLQYNRGAGVDVVTSETWSPNVWNAVSLEYISNGSGTLNLSRTGTITLGSSIWFDNVTWTRIGAIVNLDLTPGVGLFFPDMSTNVLHGIGNGGISHTMPKEYGTMTVVVPLLHSDISATAGTTKLFDLPPNCGIVNVELDRTLAMDPGVTINVGNGGSATRYASGLAASSSGPIGAASSFQTSESSSATTAIFIQKSGATTSGSLRARITYQIRG